MSKSNNKPYDIAILNNSHTKHEVTISIIKNKGAEVILDKTYSIEGYTNPIPSEDNPTKIRDVIGPINVGEEGIFTIRAETSTGLEASSQLGLSKQGRNSSVVSVYINPDETIKIIQAV